VSFIFGKFAHDSITYLGEGRIFIYFYCMIIIDIRTVLFESLVVPQLDIIWGVRE